jgi:phosphoribosylamine--glycine ligase
MKKVVVLGSGGRQSSVVWKMAQSGEVDTIYFLPGMPGIKFDKKVQCVDLDPSNFRGVADFCLKNKVAYVITGDSELLANGVVDFMRQAGVPIFGPTKQATLLESSKTYAKDFMRRHDIPTVNYASFVEILDAIEYIKGRNEGAVVVKADGLVHGRGVTVANNKQEAMTALYALMQEGSFGERGMRVVIEDFIEGPEVSLHVLSDGESYKIFPLAQDHKPLHEGNKGPNTGGMGTYAPVSWVSKSLLKEIEERIIIPTFNGLKKEGVTFSGLLFPGLMLTKQGPMVLEYNTRFGAPETQSFMTLLESNLDNLFSAVIEKKLSDFEIIWKPGYAVTVEVVSKNYPESLESKPVPIKVKETGFSGQYFFSGVAVSDGALYTKGGKVVSVSAYSDTSLDLAIKEAYKGVSGIEFSGSHYRNDIGSLQNIIPEYSKN